MIGYIKGNVLRAKDGVVLLECNGIGFNVICTEQTYDRLEMTKSGEVYTYLDVREDSMQLYGFDSIAEKEMFLRLISVSGVGPKIGIAILSNMTLKDIASCIATSDILSLSRVKGLGKKTAERIIVELREIVTKMDIGEGSKGSKKPVKTTLSPIEEDSIIALMSLGFSRSVSEEAVKLATASGADTVETILTIALQSMN